jgi:hypothetical protein
MNSDGEKFYTKVVDLEVADLDEILQIFSSNVSHLEPSLCLNN